MPPAAGLTLTRYLRQLIALSMTLWMLLATPLAVDNVQRLRNLDDRQAEQLARELAVAVDEVLRRRISALAFRHRFASDLIVADGEGRMLLHGRRADGSELLPLPRTSAVTSG